MLLWRGADGAELEPFREIVLDEGLAATVQTGAPLAFLDAELPASRPLRIDYALELLDARGARCAPGFVELELPAAPPAPSAPTVRAVGLAVRIEAPPDATDVVRLHRRSIHDRQQEPIELVAAWHTDEPVYVDVDVEPGGIYAYSVQNTATARIDGQREAPLALSGPRGAEAYAPVVPPERLIDLDPASPAAPSP